MTRARWFVVVIVAVVAVAAVGGYVVYDQFLRGDQVAALALPSIGPSTVPVAGAASGTTAPAAPAADAGSVAPKAGHASPAAATGGAPATGPSTPTGLTGTWSVAPGSVAGYRVREQLASLPAQSDAVGRTQSVTGTATLVAAGDSVQVTAASFTVDMTTLASDRSMRDQRLHTMGIETDLFPTSTFVLTSPIDVPAAALTGAQVDVTLVGDLTLHGVTKPVSIPAKAQLANGQVQISGSIMFPFSDYAIVAPDIGGFVQVVPQGTLEFLVTFGKG